MTRVPAMLIGNRIRLARETMGLDARELGELLGVSASAVTSWERGRTEPSLARIVALAAALDVDETWLAFGKVVTMSSSLPTNRSSRGRRRPGGAGRRPSGPPRPRSVDQLAPQS